MAGIKANYLFVYGYLMRKNRIINELGVPDMPVEYLGDGFIYGELYQVAGFPGLVYKLNKRSRAFGEIYLIKEQKRFFKEMDAYELSYPNYQEADAVYHRRVRPAHLMSGQVLPCWVYEYTQPTDDLKRIKSGKFNLLY
ncbi:MAG: gamma-glutamylcyclotransferase [Bacteroidota bacterium]